MSHNPKRRLLRHALHAEGWRTSSPKSGRRRGTPKAEAARNVAVTFGVLHARTNG